MKIVLNTCITVLICTVIGSQTTSAMSDDKLHKNQLKIESEYSASSNKSLSDFDNPEELPTEELPTEELPTEGLPTEELPTEELPTEELPTEEIPTEEIPTEEIPTGELPTEEFPLEEMDLLPDLISPFAVDYEEYSSNSVIVYTFLGLKTILEGSNNYTTVYFGAGITMTGGIAIPSSKTQLTIEGTNPNSPSAVYTLTEVQSVATGQTIALASNSSLKLTVQNLNIVGYNVYGTFYVPSSTNTSTVVITYNHVTYAGPQMSYNPYGKCIYIDCDIQLITRSASPQELAELNKVEFGGTVTVNSLSTSDSLFWFRGSSASVKIQPNANVSLTIQTDMCYSDAGDVEMVVGENATLAINARNGLFRSSSHRASDFTIQYGANVTINHQNSSGSATINCSGTFSVASDVALYIQSPATVLNFTGLLSSIQITDPNSVFLYSSSGNVFNFSLLTAFSFSSQQINFWTSLISLPVLGVTVFPTANHFYKSDDSDLILSGTATNTLISSVSSNLNASDEVTLPALLNLNNAKVLSMGRLPLTVNAIKATNTVITGTTMPGALITVSYIIDGTPVTLSGNTNSQGGFSIPIGNAIPSGTVVTVKSDYLLLYKISKMNTTIGEYLQFGTVPASLPYNIASIPSMKSLIPRQQADWSLTVEDSRTSGRRWDLFASISAPMTSIRGYTLSNALVYVDKNNIVHPLNDTITKVFTGSANTTSGVLTTSVTWNENQGILLQISPAEVVTGEEYSAIITWTLQDAL